MPKTSTDSNIRSLPAGESLPPKTAKPVRAKTLKRKDQILEAALRCFTAHGIAATTIDLIRSESGASVGSLYHHFGSKEAIASALYMQGMEDHFLRLRTALNDCHSAEQGVKAIVKTYCEWISENPDWARFIFGSRGEALSEEQEQKLRQDNKAHFTYLQDWFRPYLDAGELKDYPFSIYHSLLVGPAQDYAKHWLSGRQKKPLRDYIELFCEAAWKTLAP
ncbi:TetR/AcrR family transcriptional regulator [Hahella ganghwensis]|uniref:TetR/AcrR family transcriptional regulator n=1 Tax=Hahella ganghwensis TaxID=286420 RepID=UPI00037ED599|nr:TetR/AcrR family transcriptional regulator [Hahella ganghwensis]